MKVIYSILLIYSAFCSYFSCIYFCFTVIETLRCVGKWVCDSDEDEDEFEYCGERVWLVDPAKEGVALLQHENDLHARPQFCSYARKTPEDWTER